MVKKFIDVCIILVFASSAVFAGEKYQGMAAYRDGVVAPPLYEYHAGIFIGRDANDINPIIHAGPNYNVSRVPYYAASGNNFLRPNIFNGVFTKSVITSTKLDSIRLLASDLTYEGIGYTALNVIEHNSTGTRIYPANIVKLRCDGVVEYCYEYNGVKVVNFYEGTLGKEYWDISLTLDAVYHGGTKMSPRSQTGYLTKMSDSAY